MAEIPTTSFDPDALLRHMPARVHAILEARAAAAPGGLAYLAGGRRFTWSEILVAARRLCDGLAARGVRPGDRVAVTSENGVATVALFFACSMLGAAAAVINARLPPNEVERSLETADPRLVLHATADSAAAGVHAASRSASDLLDDRLFSFLAEPARAAAIAEPAPPDAEALGCLLFTSGTTGRPKGVMLSHRAMIYAAAAQADARGLTAEDTVYVISPFAHTMGINANMLAAAWSCASALLEPRFDPAELAGHLIAGRISVMVTVPQVFSRLMDYAAARGLPLKHPRLRVIGTGGAATDSALRQRARDVFGLPLSNAYACTEMAPIARVPYGEDVQSDTIGRPPPGVEVRIVGPDGMPLGADEVGELWARGPSAMSGYFRDPEATAIAMRDSWIRTGDLARRDPEGRIHIAGRLKEMIIRSGFNVYPVEVEAALSSHPDVAASAVVGRKVEGDEEVIAFIEPVSGRGVDPAALRAHLKTLLAPYKVPTEFREVRSMPRGVTGKILKRTLIESAA